MKQNFKCFLLAIITVLFLFACTNGTSTDPGKTTPSTNNQPPATNAPKTAEAPTTTSPDVEAPKLAPPVVEEEESSFTTKIGDCIYIDYVGLATIKNISAAPKDGENCPDAMLVEFAFGPVNPSDVRNYKYTLFKDASQFMTISDGLNPSKAWVKRMGLEEGLVLQCKRQELFEGDCTEVLFSFEELDMEPKTKCK